MPFSHCGCVMVRWRFPRAHQRSIKYVRRHAWAANVPTQGKCRNGGSRSAQAGLQHDEYWVLAKILCQTGHPPRRTRSCTVYMTCHNIWRLWVNPEGAPWQSFEILAHEARKLATRPNTTSWPWSVRAETFSPISRNPESAVFICFSAPANLGCRVEDLVWPAISNCGSVVWVTTGIQHAVFVAKTAVAVHFDEPNCADVSSVVVGNESSQCMADIWPQLRTKPENTWRLIQVYSWSTWFLSVDNIPTPPNQPQPMKLDFNPPSRRWFFRSPIRLSATCADRVSLSESRRFCNEHSNCRSLTFSIA